MVNVVDIGGGVMYGCIYENDNIIFVCGFVFDGVSKIV